MYSIIVDGELKALCDSPNYVKKNDNGIWVSTSADDFEAVAVRGELFMNPLVTKEDGAEFIFKTENKTTQNQIDITDVQDALVELAEIITGGNE